ncbi:hypothetical protein F444_21007 [Phytophthora nicotianae P1976]|uniref:Uncharacterized protein n=1 Tax=Phytophthora nicotianae P1976 TaxID=1317066 RepID=A0A080Z2J9_PHYNI|nr:hypothetical protein F444_21007 [Phytophthora nicotianae P1976]
MTSPNLNKLLVKAVKFLLDSTSRIFASHTNKTLGCHLGIRDRVIASRTTATSVSHILLPWPQQYDVQRDLKFDIVAGVTVSIVFTLEEISLFTIMNVPATTACI